MIAEHGARAEEAISRMSSREIVLTMRQHWIDEYQRAATRAEQPAVPRVVVEHASSLADHALRVGLCLAWLEQTGSARAWLARATRHYHGLFSLALRAPSAWLRREALRRAELNNAREALHSLALTGWSMEQRHDFLGLMDRFSEARRLESPALRLYDCALRDLLGGRIVESRVWAAQVGGLRRGDRIWSTYFNGAQACLAIADRNAAALMPPINAIPNRHQLTVRGGWWREMPEGLMSLMATALLGLAIEHGLDINLDIPHGNYVARCFLPSLPAH